MAEAPTLTVFSDFICPFCYIGKVQTERLQQRHPDLQVQWREIELHPETEPAPDPAYLEQAREAAAHLAERYAIPLRAEVVTTLTSPSHRALLGLEFARDADRADAYRDAVFEAYWQQARDIGDLAVLAAIATEVGLDEAAFRRAVEAEEGSERLQANRAEDRRIGLDGVPTFIAGPYKTSGAQPLELLERMLAQAREAGSPPGEDSP